MFDLAALNSATKYPSIPTYHALNPKNGKLIEAEPTIFNDTVYATEKVDGTNTRVIFLSTEDGEGDFYVGSREHLIHAKGDRVHNPQLDILRTVLPLIAEVRPTLPIPTGTALVLYMEVYGGKITGASKQYTADPGLSDARVFDAVRLPLDILARPLPEISAWRENGGQDFLDEDDLMDLLVDHTPFKTTPLLNILTSGEMPLTLAGMQELLNNTALRTRAGIGEIDTATAGQAEGIVFRTTDRKQIAKARHTDYKRSLR